MAVGFPRIANPKIAILLMTFYGFTGGCLGTYLVSMVSTMEKRFEWPTSQVGWLLSADDIGYLSTVLLVAYYSSKGKQTLVLSASSLLMFCAACLRSSPFFIFGSKFSTDQILGMRNSSSGLFYPNNLVNQSITDKLIPNFAKQQLWAFVIQIFGGILHGVAATPFWNVGLALIDDMGGRNSGAYMGFMFLIRTLSPICGFLLGGQLAKVNENLQLEPNDFPLGLRDPMWIGAWWLGLLAIGSVVFLNTPLMAMLDVKRLQEAGERDRQKAKVKSELNGEETRGASLPLTAATVGSVTSLHAAEQEAATPDLKDLSFGDLYYSIKDLFTNMVFVTMFLGNVFEFAAFVIFIGYFPKYLEYHFYLTANKASMLASIALAGASAMAVIISGTLSKLRPMSMTSMNLYHAIANTVSACIFPLLFLFDCKKIDMIGSHNFMEEMPKLNTSCTVNVAGCSKFDYKPVCVGDKSFMSPCHAGCQETQFENGTSLFTNCLCSSDLTAAAGVCQAQCSNVLLYIGLFSIIRVIGGMASVQFSLIMMRLPSKRHLKPLAMGAFSFLFGVMGIIMPPLGGKLIETVCLVQNPSATGRSFCLFYDTDKFRHLMHSVGTVFQIPACIVYFLSYFASRKLYPDNEDGTERDNGRGRRRKQRQEDEDEDVVADVAELQRLSHEQA